MNLAAWVLQIRPTLTPLAAAGLVIIMVGAVVYHAGRGEGQNIVFNLVLAALLAFVAWVRWRGHPLEPGVR